MREHTNTIDLNVRRAEESVGVRSERSDDIAALAASAIRIARAATSIHLAQSVGLPSPDDQPTDNAANGALRFAREQCS